MSFDDALRLTELLLGFALFQQSVEHLAKPRDDRALFLPRAVLSLLLMAGLYTPWVCAALFLFGIRLLHRFQGPYNGGSDRMGLLILACLTLTHTMPSLRAQELVFGYLALQLVLSYGIAGWVKIVNPEWRSGRALQDVFQFSAYPMTESLRTWSTRPRTLRLMSWAVILFELTFPLALLTHPTLIIALTIAACFHLANAYLFGLNRFFWVWIAAYPSILWLQGRV